MIAFVCFFSLYLPEWSLFKAKYTGKKNDQLSGPFEFLSKCEGIVWEPQINQWDINCPYCATSIHQRHPSNAFACCWDIKWSKLNSLNLKASKIKHLSKFKISHCESVFLLIWKVGLILQVNQKHLDGLVVGQHLLE